MRSSLKLNYGTPAISGAPLLRNALVSDQPPSNLPTWKEWKDHHAQLGHRVLLSSWSDVDIREIQAHVALHLPLLQATLARWATGARIGRALTTLSVNRPPPGTRSSLVSCAQNAR